MYHYDDEGGLKKTIVLPGVNGTEHVLFPDGKNTLNGKEMKARIPIKLSKERIGEMKIEPGNCSLDVYHCPIVIHKEIPNSTTVQSASSGFGENLTYYIIGGIAGFVVLGLITGVPVCIHCRRKKKPKNDDKEMNKAGKDAKEKTRETDATTSTNHAKTEAEDNELDDNTFGSFVGYCRNRGKKYADSDNFDIFGYNPEDGERSRMPYRQAYNFSVGSKDLTELELAILKSDAATGLEIIKKIRQQAEQIFKEKGIDNDNVPSKELRSFFRKSTTPKIWSVCLLAK
uniref:Uncharacterized protein n=1 Tax=Panagrolaimus sp. JU765 TaxID=591449 RepID=A0AC34Q4K8_9BILA